MKLGSWLAASVLAGLPACTEVGPILTLNAIEGDMVAPPASGGAAAAGGTPATGGTGSSLASGRSVLLVLGENDPEHAQDALLTQSLQRLGMVVTEHDHLSPIDVTGQDLVVVSSTAMAEAVDEQLLRAAVPVIAMEAWMYPWLGMTNPVPGEYGLSETSELVIQVEGPLAAGLAGVVTVYDSPVFTNEALRYSALSVAQLAAHPELCAICAYEAGETMPLLDAPARRLGLFVRTESLKNLTADGWSLFDAGVLWAVAR